MAEALAAEERKRTEAVEREGADRGETKWYLSVQQPPRPAHSALRIVEAGYSVLDANVEDVMSDDNEEAGETTPRLVAGRKNFGKFNRKTEVAQNAASSSQPASTLR